MEPCAECTATGNGKYCLHAVYDAMFTFNDASDDRSRTTCPQCNSDVLNLKKCGMCSQEICHRCCIYGNGEHGLCLQCEHAGELEDMERAQKWVARIEALQRRCAEHKAAGNKTFNRHSE